MAKGSILMNEIEVEEALSDLSKEIIKHYINPRKKKKTDALDVKSLHKKFDNPNLLIVGADFESAPFVHRMATIAHSTYKVHLPHIILDTKKSGSEPFGVIYHNKRHDFPHDYRSLEGKQVFLFAPVYSKCEITASLNILENWENNCVGPGYKQKSDKPEEINIAVLVDIPGRGAHKLFYRSIVEKAGLDLRMEGLRIVSITPYRKAKTQFKESNGLSYIGDMLSQEESIIKTMIKESQALYPAFSKPNVNNLVNNPLRYNILLFLSNHSPQGAKLGIISKSFNTGKGTIQPHLDELIRIGFVGQSKTGTDRYFINPIYSPVLNRLFDLAYSPPKK